ncbi:TonB family protein [Luteimonas deserti]|uniref:TonB family protein n=1 Tax=Luteimonas deserti TaxID=2752306 RepID=A0A7Z0TZD4_9GAMM|nr:TonB family protein [Luteimonas deserti]NYZ63322.1 TonB family protein [Luteimonas deserti]
MNDPLQQRPHDVPPTEPPPRKGSSPLIWILILVALVALGWYVLNQRSAESPATVPPAPVIGDGTAPVVEPEPTRPAVTPTTRPTAPADREARPLTQQPPVYPPAAVRTREEGTVTLLVQVDAEGRPGEITVETRSRSRDLDRAAIDAVRGWTFEPALRNGVAAASAVRVPVDFKLDDGSGTPPRAR